MITLLQATPEMAVEVTPVAESMSFGDLFMAGGWLMWPLLALLGVAIFIFVERFIAIRKASRVDENFMHRVRDYIYEGKIQTAIKMCRSTNTPIARMIEKGIGRIGRPMADVQNAIENQANLEVSKLENNLPILATISGGAPMIGFLGTVLGMVRAFMNLSSAGGTVDMALLSGGMYTAMITTVAVKKYNIHTAIDTAGSLPLSYEIKELLKYTDLVLLDIKHINNEKCINLTGVQSVHQRIQTAFQNTH